MIKVIFVCHGNICRSPMAEFVFKDMVKRMGIEDKFFIASAATHTDALGSPVHRGTRDMLNKKGVAFDERKAVQLKMGDDYNYYIGMDKYNIDNMRRILGKRKENICRLLDYTDSPSDVADPWYTGDFETCYNDIYRGLQAFLKTLS